MSSSTASPVQKTAAMIAIGDELLSGRTRDANLHYLAGWLAARGITLAEARVVPDDHAHIVRTINDLRGQVDYVFTSGGIGPTHDDITADAVAAAFGLEADENPEAIAIMEKFYSAIDESLNPGRRRMARTPPGCSLIQNEINGPPGFQIKNVFVMAGIPAIFRSMLKDVDHRLEHGPVSVAWTVRVGAIESLVAEGLRAVQAENPDVSIGSYPGKTGNRGSVSIVTRGLDANRVKLVAREILGMMKAQDIAAEFLEGDGSTDQD